jgi:aspartate/methionine/tyrosine aminotransferase
MATGAVSERVGQMSRAIEPFMDAIVRGPIGRMPRDRPVADFAAGNPQEGTLPEFLAALQRWSVPQNTGWFGYKEPDRRAREVAAAALSARLDLPFETDDVYLARGASGGLAIALQALVDPGDEVVLQSPPWSS